MFEVLEGLSFEGKCRLLGVAPRDSGMCVDTAAGVGGAIVPVGVPGSRAAKPRIAHGLGRGLTVGSRRICSR